MHAWLTWVGVVLAPAAAFWDLDLYRWWMYRALVEGTWPVLDDPWVYPAGAVLPMLLPGLGSTVSTPQYALGWCLLVALLDGAALAVLLRLPRGAAAAGWWTAALLLLGPVALGRLDAVITPLSMVALAVAATPGARGRRARVATALLTAGAWVKVAPGALLLPLAAAARRPWRDVVLPAGLVTAALVGAVAAGGGGARLGSFLTTQTGRGLQLEAVGATPWVLATLGRDDVTIALDEALVTYQVHGPGTTAAARALDVVLVGAVLTVAAVLVHARRRGRAPAALLPAALALSTALVVANKVGSPQYLTWLVPPVAVLLAVGTPDGWARDAQHRWLVAAAGLALLASGLTQVVFPWGYPALLAGDPTIAVVLTLRNATLVAVLACAAVGLRAALRPPPPR
ncbi:hypothetical protein [Actinotalea sp.]|uniref:hypothetical protein n=1 Tax=Actinotalea sp. TaxID=1872145 RepID=UPI002C21D348|nr:hypothetical protein [Actinotalea sp.]HRA51192.1 hypothetical protein [Actinotalea sp.]